jgi:hypothetical protein
MLFLNRAIIGVADTSSVMFKESVMIEVFQDERRFAPLLPGR